jgi:hypothetical protein
VGIDKEDTLPVDDGENKFKWGLTGLLYGVELVSWDSISTL